MSEKIISVHHIDKSVSDASGTLHILRDIDFSLSVGETMAILGASGSGKSTLLSIMAGLDTPSAGSVQIAGQNLFDMSEDERAAWRGQHVGFVFQSFQLMGHLNALENVQLEQVGLGQRMKHFPKVLSGGEQQRVALARAFVMRPQLLLADEPTGSLDAETGQSIMDLMLALNQSFATTLVLVTHDMRLAQKCERFITLEAGRMRSEG